MSRPNCKRKRRRLKRVRGRQAAIFGTLFDELREITAKHVQAEANIWKDFGRAFVVQQFAPPCSASMMNFLEAETEAQPTQGGLFEVGE